MKNIKNYEPFEPENIDIKNYDILLKSIAYFILRGDDLEKLLNILIEKNMKIFKMAFGLWGALFGFSAIPKTISNILFKEENKNIIDIQDFLQNMYKKIDNIDDNQEIKISYIQIRQTYKNIGGIQAKKELKIKKNIPTKCPICDSDMIKKSVGKGKFKGYEFFGCSRYPKCEGKRDLKYHELDKNFNRIDNSKSLVSKEIDYAKKPFTSDNNLDDIIYDFIKEQGGKVKIADARKVIKIKTNKDFKDKYAEDNRFELYKEKNTEMIRIK